MFSDKIETWAGGGITGNNPCHLVLPDPSGLVLKVLYRTFWGYLNIYSSYLTLIYTNLSIYVSCIITSIYMYHIVNHPI